MRGEKTWNWKKTQAVAFMKHFILDLLAWGIKSYTVDAPITDTVDIWVDSGKQFAKIEWV